jgi:hypothetical protein
MDEIKLKPCPFCGADEWVERFGDGETYLIHKYDCFLMRDDFVETIIPLFQKDRIDAKKWNRRAKAEREK